MLGSQEKEIVAYPMRPQLSLGDGLLQLG